MITGAAGSKAAPAVKSAMNASGFFMGAVMVNKSRAVLVGLRIVIRKNSRFFPSTAIFAFARTPWPRLSGRGPSRREVFSFEKTNTIKL